MQARIAQERRAPSGAVRGWSSLVRWTQLVRGVGVALPVLLVVAACAPAAPPAQPAAANASTARPASAVVQSGATAVPDKPALPVTPLVNVKVGAQPVASNAPWFLAHHLGYFREAGINVEFASASNVNDLLSSLAQGQLHAGSCSNNVGCFNALHRGIDVRIVSDHVSAAKTPKSIGASAIVVRKDLWDAGTIRGPRDLAGRSVYVPAGPGSGYHVLAARWLRGQQIDPSRTEWVQMPLPDVLAAMQNRAIELGFQIEPLLTTGVSRGVYEILATAEEMDPTYQLLYQLFWSGIDSLGPMVGERFMVAYLRGARAAINAFEYGIDQEAAIAALVQETTIKDPAVFRQIKYPWVDPNGLVSRAALEADAELLRDLGLMPAVNLSNVFDDRYRQFAVQYLGEYRPPQ